MATLEDTLHFFDAMPGALPWYEQLLARARAELGPFDVRVQKTQITWVNPHIFACVSFAKVRKAKDRPKTYMVVTFGLEHRAESPRIDIATEPYPNRWTHHLLLSGPEEIDAELMGWLREAYLFSAEKGGRRRKGR